MSGPTMTEAEVRDMLEYDVDTVVETMRSWGFLDDTPVRPAAVQEDGEARAREALFAGLKRCADLGDAGPAIMMGGKLEEVVVNAMLAFAASERADERERAAMVAETDGTIFACTKRRTRRLGLARSAYGIEVAREIATAIRAGGHDRG